MYASTRRKHSDASPFRASFSEALLRGLAPDGGLFVPESFPAFRREDFEGLKPFPAIAARALEPFLAGDALAEHLRTACERAFDFPVPLTHLDDATSVLELFHGPSCAFKDFGARFLAEMLARMPARRPSRSHAAPRTVLVATSGDTGGAVAAAFHKKRGIRVVILFPEGKIAPRQEKQLTAWGANVRALAVHGDFDDCQRLVKKAFADEDLATRLGLVSANSINIARLLPQVAYYAAASLWHLRERGAAPSFIVPSGNLGNAVGALWAKRIGFPVARVVMAANANAAVPEYLRTGAWRPRPTIATLANAMDVGNPGNMERVLALYPDAAALRRDVDAVSATDGDIRRAIAAGMKRWGQVFDPHTATTVFAHEKLACGRTGGAGHWILVATAHPAKFDTIVEPLVGAPVPVPEQLAKILRRRSRCTRIEPSFKALKAAL